MPAGLGVVFLTGDFTCGFGVTTFGTTVERGLEATLGAGRGFAGAAALGAADTEDELERLDDLLDEELLLIAAAADPVDPQITAKTAMMVNTRCVIIPPTF